LANNVVLIGVIYGSVLMSESDIDAAVRERLRSAVGQVILACDANAVVLWEMSYVSQSISIDGPSFPAFFVTDPSGCIIAFQPNRKEIAFDDSLVDAVEAVWEKIMGPPTEDLEFMRFAERSGGEIED